MGGTGEAAELAAKAGKISGVEVINSLAGRTRQAAISSPPGRIGSFGGVAGLREYLQEQEIDGLIDAAHPLAAQISGNAAQATDDCNIPRLMLYQF